MSLRCWTFGIALLAAQSTAAVLPAGEKSSTPAAGTAANGVLSEFLSQIVRDQLEHEYVDDHDWGKTRRVTVGYRVKGKPFQWDLKRRTKEVNDGLWEKYTVRLVDPQEHLQVQISRLQMVEGRLEFSVWLTAKVHGDARLERWRQGVKMLNTHLEATGTIEVHLAGSVGIQLEAGSALPAIALEPEISKVEIKLRKFNLKRISKLEGKAARELGEEVHDLIQKELNRREPRIVAKLNRSIAKRKDKLRFSPEEFARQGWQQLGSLGK